MTDTIVSPDKQPRPSAAECDELLRERVLREELLRKSENFLRSIGELTAAGGWELDLATRQLYWSEETCRLHGMPLDFQPDVETAIGLYGAAVQPELRAALALAITEGEGFDLEMPLLRPDGQERWVRLVGEVEHVAGKAVRLAGAFQDVTERHQMVAEMAEQTELLRVLLDAVGDAVITTDKVGRVDWLNPVAEGLTGWSMKQAHGRLLDEVFRRVELADPLLAGADGEPGPAPAALPSGETMLVARDGSEVGIEYISTPVLDQLARQLGKVLVFRGAAQQRRAAGEMQRSTLDALTGLVNKTELENRLGRLLQRARAEGSAHALLLLNVDKFKQINEDCGESGGDQILKQLARLLGDSVRARDTLARLGGDQFAIILDHCAAGQAQRVAQEICQRIADFQFRHQERRLRLGVSVGLVGIDNSWPSTVTLLQAGAAACASAKETGGGRVHLWSDSDLALAARHGEMQRIERIEQALDEDGFVLFGQRMEPVVPEGAGIHAEVLLRMRGDDGELLLPGAFMPTAERARLAPRVDRWVVVNAVAWLEGLMPELPVETLCINLHGQSVADPVFHAWLIELLLELPPPLRRCLCFEIYETEEVGNLADAASFIAQLRNAGVRVTLDDFGAAAASLGDLKNMCIDYIKIDGQFIQNLLADPLNSAAVRSFCEAANILGLQVIAECIDQPQVLARLNTLGVDFAQGFLVHQPEPLEALAVARLVD